MNQEQARKRIRVLQGFYWHLASFIAVNLFLLAINLLTSPGTLWFLFPLLGWGIGLGIHSAVLFMGKDWEERKMEELTGLKTTRDELHKLAERTDTLARIMASVDWERIDPELKSTKQNLESARHRLADLQARGDTAGQKELAREIERLEEFVTSPRFSYYELAAQEQREN